jgi:hypothetical protein
MLSEAREAVKSRCEDKASQQFKPRGCTKSDKRLETDDLLKAGGSRKTSQLPETSETVKSRKQSRNEPRTKTGRQGQGGYISRGTTHHPQLKTGQQAEHTSKGLRVAQLQAEGTHRFEES